MPVVTSEVAACLPASDEANDHPSSFLTVHPVPDDFR